MIPVLWSWSIAALNKNQLRPPASKVCRYRRPSRKPSNRVRLGAVLIPVDTHNVISFKLSPRSVVPSETPLTRQYGSDPADAGHTQSSLCATGTGAAPCSSLQHQCLGHKEMVLLYGARQPLHRGSWPDNGNTRSLWPSADVRATTKKLLQPLR